MGLFFANLHVRKNENYDTEALKDTLIRLLAEDGFTPAQDESEGNICVAICAPPRSEWVSVASDTFQVGVDDSMARTAARLSQRFDTDVITAACFDSDDLQLSLLNTRDGTDGWINVGRSEEVPHRRRTKLSPWSKLVGDMPRLKEIVRTEHVFAEEAFAQIAELIRMEPAQATLEVGASDLLPAGQITRLFFAAPPGTVKPPKFEIALYGGMPCRIGESSVVSVHNAGGKSKGLGVMFIGDCVDQGEIAFEDVKLQLRRKKAWEFVPIELKKADRGDGKTCWYWVDPSFPIPPAVNENIPLRKRLLLAFERGIGVRFTPVGNPRKVLDITVVVYPLENPNGQASWCVYRLYGTKRDYIEQHNVGIQKTLDNGGRVGELLLNPDDYDLD
ncbi:MAG: hypothetical protein IJJ99_07320 [Oscillospiraceae bacterium]|nr:hypothetical protein [Oscillospiraceae bacterium]